MTLFLCQFTMEYRVYMRDESSEDAGLYRLVEADSAEEAKLKLIAKLEHIDTYGFTTYITNVEVHEVIR